ncbi:MAG TPA: hypothetical protein VHW60_01455 [Caulobacteraceae bacterium]|jgi:hypothetical protein|nr:hypothetical protein [Caulobacteraceae bacterium]
MRRITNGPLCVAVAVGALLAGCQPSAPTAAAAGGGGAVAPTPVSFPAGATAQTTFTDPTEDAFTVSVPQGWTVRGGVQRSSPIAASLWVTATSPDGATVIEIGDPSIPSFVAPSAAHPAGSTVQTAFGAPGLAEPYESGVQFAQDYAARTFAQTCALRPLGTQAEPGLAQTAQASTAQIAAQVGVPPPAAQFDGGSATFGCQVNGASDAVGVIAVTGLTPLPVDNVWTVSLLVAYRTPAASQAQTDQLARAMRASMTPNPQWQLKMAAAERQQLATIQQNALATQAALAARAARAREALTAEQASNAALAANHTRSSAAAPN